MVRFDELRCKGASDWRDAGRGVEPGRKSDRTNSRHWDADLAGWPPAMLIAARLGRYWRDSVE